MRHGLALEGTRPDYRVKEETRHTECLYGAPISTLDAERFRRCAEQLGLG